MGWIKKFAYDGSTVGKSVTVCNAEKDAQSMAYSLSTTLVHFMVTVRDFLPARLSSTVPGRSGPTVEWLSRAARRASSTERRLTTKQLFFGSVAVVKTPKHARVWSPDARVPGGRRSASQRLIGRRVKESMLAQSVMAAAPGRGNRPACRPALRAADRAAQPQRLQRPAGTHRAGRSGPGSPRGIRCRPGSPRPRPPPKRARGSGSAGLGGVSPHQGGAVFRHAAVAGPLLGIARPRRPHRRPRLVQRIPVTRDGERRVQFEGLSACEPGIGALEFCGVMVHECRGL